MRGYRVGRGRKKAVREFKTQNGLWIIAVLLAGFIAIVLLWHIGFLRFGEH